MDARLNLWILIAALGVAPSACTMEDTSCVARGTRVDTPNGPRRIEDIRVGDIIHAVDMTSGELVPTEVLAIQSATRECVALGTAGATLRCTSDHPVYDPLEDAYAPAGDWALGQRTAIAMVDGDGVQTHSITRREMWAGIHEVFDLTVASQHHNFIADGVVVHNKSIALVCDVDGMDVPYGESCVCADMSSGFIACDTAGSPGICECASDMAQDVSDTSVDTASPDIGSDATAAERIRFAIEVTNDVPESIWVQLNRDDGQTAWVTVSNAAGDRIWLDERCEISDCVNPSGVCGAALPFVRDITGASPIGSIERTWDGLTSVVDDGNGGCELREPAPDGDYTATFCWSLSVTGTGAGEPTVGVEGEVENPVCIDVQFTIPGERDVVYRILGG